MESNNVEIKFDTKFSVAAISNKKFSICGNNDKFVPQNFRLKDWNAEITGRIHEVRMLNHFVLAKNTNWSFGI